MTNNSIFTRVLALMLCLIMLVGTLTACFNEVDLENNVGTTTNGGVVTTNPTTKPTTTTTTTPTTGGVVEDDPVEDPVEPVDPNEIFSASTDILSDGLIYGTLASDVVIGGTEMGALVPADVKVEAGASSLALSVKKVDEVLLSDALSTLDVHINGVALDNTVPMVVKLGAILEAGLGATELKLYHTENGVDNLMTRVNSPADFAIHNQYYYNAETGEVTIYVASFSVFTAVQSTASVWTEETVADTSWYNAEKTEFILEDVADFLGFRDLVDGKVEGIGAVTFEGKTVTLGTDLDLNKKLFNPIGGGWAYNGGKTFNGTFDGGNHTIYNLRVNGWELDETGDKHSGTSMGAGLFSSLHNATIRNLAVVGSELIVETTSIGIIAGVAQGKCTFENIVVSDATLGNYQMRNGGIVGDIYVIESDNVPEGEDKYSHTFTNIVVDSTVKLSSMWGDFDTGNGGVIGGKYGSSKVLMENVTVACELDVFSDVTAAYQWYAYRRCGMLVGYTGQNSPKQATNAAADFLTCKNVNVYYGDWVNYTYYQFANQTDVDGNRLWNSNYPWVRAEESPYNGAFSNVRYGNPIIKGEKINSVEAAQALNAPCVTIKFDQLYGGGQGVYGTAHHEKGGVSVHNTLTKTVYVNNNLGWENLKLYYWFANGNDTWTTLVEGIDMSTMLAEGNVYKLEIPAYAYGFVILADGENVSDTFVLAELKENETVDLGIPAHEHIYDNDCDTTCNVCEETRTVGEHVYDNACDTTCNVCNATREVGGHVYTNNCDADCNVCGAERTPEDHVYENACDTICNECGATRKVENHVWNISTCVCSVCGVSATTKTIYFQNNWLWTSVKVSDGTTTVNMTKVENDGVYDIYKITLPENCTVTISDGTNEVNKHTQPIDVSDLNNNSILYMNYTVEKGHYAVIDDYATYTDGFRIVRLKPTGWWTGARYAAYVWNGSVNKWIDMVDVDGDGIYTCWVPNEYSNIKFGRMNPDNPENSFTYSDKGGAMWNETGNLTVPDNTDKFFVPLDDLWELEGDKVIFLKPNNDWKKDGARFAVRFWIDSPFSEIWVSMTDFDGDGIYSCVVPNGYSKLIFCRMNGSKIDNNWNNKWNQTGDLTIQTNGNMLFTITSWDGQTTGWSKK